MYEPLAVLLGILGLAYLVLVPVFVLIAFVRTNRLESLERRLERLEHLSRLPQASAPLPAQSSARVDSAWGATVEPRTEPPPASAPAPLPQVPQPPQPPPPPSPPARPLPVAATTPRPTAPPAQPAATARAPRPEIDWERWLGVRGAAIVAGILLALAALFLFRHALVAGWIGPRARVAIGLLCGTVAIGWGRRLRRGSYVVAPEALEGAGIVAFYASIWAAGRLYDLVPIPLAFAGMAAVTGLACVLSLRANSLLTAVLALCGGFATPLLLGNLLERPLSLFSYVLILDGALLLVGIRRRWPSLGLLAVLGTFAMQALWTFARGGAEQAVLAVPILGVFAFLFALASGWSAPPGEEANDRTRGWVGTQAAAVLLPFLFAFHFASAFPWSEGFRSTAVLVFLLTLAACIVARGRNAPLVALAASAAGIGVLALRMVAAARVGALDEGRLAVELLVAITIVGLVPLAAAALRWGRFAGVPAALGPAAIAGPFAALLVAAASGAFLQRAPWPQLAAMLVLFAATTRGAVQRRRAPEFLAAAFLVGLGLMLHLVVAQRDAATAALVDPRSFATVVLLVGLALVVVAARGRAALGRAAGHAPALALLPLLAAVPWRLEWLAAFDPWLAPCLVLALSLLVAAAGIIAVTWVWYACAIAVAALLQLVCLGPTLRGLADGERPALTLAILLVSAVVFTAWPFVARAVSGARSPHVERANWRFAAFAAPAWLVALALTIGRFDQEPFGARTFALAGCIAALPAALAALLPRDERRIPRAWCGGVACAFFAVALARWLGVEEDATALALATVAWALLARALVHEGLASLSAAATLAVTARLAVTAVAPGHYARADSLLWNEIVAVHVLCGGAALCAAWCTARVARGTALARGRTGVFVLAGAVIAFIAVNLVIWNHYEDGERIVFRLVRLPARDLAMSLAWGVYALLLLVLGAAAVRGRALRWMSLALFLTTIVKVFLVDLGHLSGLYRVGSLAGLAMSLLVVSLLYQRFILRARTEAQDS